MTILVTDRGFAPDDWTQGYVPLAALSDSPSDDYELAVDLRCSALSAGEWRRLCRVLPRVSLIRLGLRHFGDVDALELARAIRRHGFAGRLRAHGAVLARFYTLVRQAGFSEIELDQRQAQRQPSEHWRLADGWVPDHSQRGPHSAASS